MSSNKIDENFSKLVIVFLVPIILSYLIPGAISALSKLTNKMGGIGNVLIIIIPITIAIGVYKAYTKK